MKKLSRNCAEEDRGKYYPTHCIHISQKTTRAQGLDKPCWQKSLLALNLALSSIQGYEISLLVNERNFLSDVELVLSVL